jgi:diguanylate cyclase (GGDEF)-like protein
MTTVTVGIVVALVLAAVAAALISHRSMRRVRRQLDDATTTDTLTNLPNRTWLVDELARRLESSGGQPGIVLVAMHRFDLINSMHGHEVGDALLVEVAARLGRVLTDGETLARVSGPVFAVVVTGLDEREARARAIELRDSLQVPVRVAGEQLAPRIDAGACVAGRTTESADQLLNDAVAALRTSESSGEVALFEIAMRERLASGAPEDLLRDAVDRAEFWLLYLPVVELETNAIVGLESLLRWANPERGMVPAGEFLEQLHETGLIAPLGRWVLEETCRHNVAWAEQFPDRHLLSTVNLSAEQVIATGLAETVLEVVDATGIDPGRLCLEIADTGALDVPVEHSWSVLRPVKERGVKLALDDFGVAHASLSYLRRYQLDVLKIDRSLVASCVDDPRDAALIEQVVNLAHGLDIVPVAEGVDRPEQAELLQTMRCDFAQGYWFSPPQPAETIDRMLARGRLTPGTPSGKIDWTGRSPK